MATPHTNRLVARIDDHLVLVLDSHGAALGMLLRQARKAEEAEDSKELRLLCAQVLRARVPYPPRHFLSADEPESDPEPEPDGEPLDDDAWQDPQEQPSQSTEAPQEAPAADSPSLMGARAGGRVAGSTDTQPAEQAPSTAGCPDTPGPGGEAVPGGSNEIQPAQPSPGTAPSCAAVRCSLCAVAPVPDTS